MYDFIIIGGGSAGCVLANRLSANPAHNVLLLESGNRGDSPLIKVPLGAAAMVPSRINNWAFQTTPQPGLNNRQGYQPRGRTLGGSSAINAMVYIRGHATDYDDWEACGNPGWSYDDVLPYFKKSQHQERGADAFHGVGGPLNVADISYSNPVIEAFVEAGIRCGHAHNPDFNGSHQEGIGRYQVTQINGERCSAARAYLHPVLSRPNLTVITRARALRLVLNGKRVLGVEYQRKGDVAQIAMARREVLLSAGALQSPQLLMLSGIGAEDELARHGIALQHELPGVGQHLQDHPDYVSVYRSSNRNLLGYSLTGTLVVAKEGLRYLRQRRGLISSNVAEGGAFLRTSPELSRPDIQLHFVIGMLDNHARKPHYGLGFSCHVCLLRPKSVGRLTLNSADPFDSPGIDPNFLGEEADLNTMIKGFRMMRQILHAEPMKAIRGKELYTANAYSDEEIAYWIRQRADTIYHPVGTCRMGPDPLSVVDHRLKVKGLAGLRVVDASIMPTLIGGNTNAPTIMIAEKAADMILADADQPETFEQRKPAPKPRAALKAHA